SRPTWQASPSRTRTTAPWRTRSERWVPHELRGRVATTARRSPVVRHAPEGARALQGDVLGPRVPRGRSRRLPAPPRPDPLLHEGPLRPRRTRSGAAQAGAGGRAEPHDVRRPVVWSARAVLPVRRPVRGRRRRARGVRTPADEGGLPGRGPLAVTLRPAHRSAVRRGGVRAVRRAPRPAPPAP